MTPGWIWLFLSHLFLFIFCVWIHLGWQKWVLWSAYRTLLCSRLQGHLATISFPGVCLESEHFVTSGPQVKLIKPLTGLQQQFIFVFPIGRAYDITFSFFANETILTSAANWHTSDNTDPPRLLVFLQYKTHAISFRWYVLCQAVFWIHSRQDSPLPLGLQLYLMMRVRNPHWQHIASALCCVVSPSTKCLESKRRVVRKRK